MDRRGEDRIVSSTWGQTNINSAEGVRTGVLDLVQGRIMPVIQYEVVGRW